MSENDLELKVLAGISIIISLEEDNKSAFNTATAAVCATLQGFVVSTLEVPPVISIAKQYLKKKSIHTRSIENTISIQKNISDFKAKKDQLIALLPQNNLPSTQAPMKELLDKIQDIFKEINKITSGIDYSLLIQKEESNMLWWITGEYSNTLNKKMSKIPLPFACLIVAKELGDMTKLLPGPLSIPALMDKMMSVGRKKRSDPLSIKEVINGATEKWRSEYIGDIDLSFIEDLCPLHYAISKSVETGDQTAWISSFEKNIGIKADQQFSPIDIAMQAYNEMLLISSIR
jgi:hypothetical protein